MEQIQLRSVWHGTSESEIIELSQTTAGTARQCVQFYLTPESDWGNGVKLKLYYEKKWKKWEREKPDELSIKHIKIWEIATLDLSRDDTKKVYEYLQQFYEVRKDWVPNWITKLVTLKDTEEIIEIDDNRKNIIKSLIDKKYSKEFRDQLLLIDPSTIDKLSHTRIIQMRSDIINEFINELEPQGVNESFWQDFFEKNTWIFWYWLDYRFLKIIEGTANIWWANSLWRGWNPEVDWLCEISDFSVLVEIKTPNANILWKDTYRTNAWSIHQDLANAISQCLWQKQSFLDNAKDKTHDKDGKKINLKYADPKVILVYWNRAQLVWDSDLETEMKYQTFELFRRNLRNIEIITFDELLERSKFINHHYFIEENHIITENDDLLFW